MGGIGSGGPRQGAGRKTIDAAPRCRVSLTLPEWMVGELRSEAELQRRPLSAVVTECLIKNTKP